MTPGPGIARTPLPEGFLCSGINCGVRRYRPDLGMIWSDRDAVAAGVFTTNKCVAAPVVYSQSLLPSSKIRAVVTNSGQANAVTGTAGDVANMRMVKAAADALGCESSQVLTASTGVIGQPMSVELICPAMPELVQRASVSAEPFAVSILTTDLVPKSISTEVKLTRGSVRITGIAKGSGMIHPNMATMLGYLLSDVQLTPTMAHQILKDVVDVSFNMISVDGDTSTNDSVFLLANGASGYALETITDIEIFKAALTNVAQALAQSIARDGEGATKLIEVRIDGATDLAVARRAARGVIVSPLVKTAIHGADPNWGRILARLGAEGVPTNSLKSLDLSIQGMQIARAGAPIEFDRKALRELLKDEKVEISVNLGSGGLSARAWGCDLSRRYVEINTEYN